MLVVVGPAVLLHVWSRTGRDKSTSGAGRRFMPLLCGGRWPAKLRARAVPRPTRILIHWRPHGRNVYTCTKHLYAVLSSRGSMAVKRSLLKPRILFRSNGDKRPGPVRCAMSRLARESISANLFPHRRI
ncbi:hypothetical protein GGI35DRAFT_437231, partial [Trichoderma velutinum]